VGDFVAGTFEAGDAALAATVLTMGEVAAVGTCAVVGPFCAVPIVIIGAGYLGVGALGYASWHDYSQL